MARPNQPLPPALPPETRTVGQLVAETLRLYGQRFWASLALGIGPGILVVVGAQLTRLQTAVFAGTAGAVMVTASYVGAAVIVSGRRPSAKAFRTGFGVGVLVFLPVPWLAQILVLPAVAWLALFGLAVPAAVIEEVGPRASLSRGLALAKADFVHALGSLATLAITAFLTQAALFFLLRGAGDSTTKVAAFLADLVISPVLFLGAALLYFDQEARLRIPRDERRRVSPAAPRQ